MAIVTNVRVESNGIDVATLRWTDNGGATNTIYRSTNGTDFAIVGTVPVDGTEVFEDSGLEPNTKYWYKISNDGGTTFSATVTVFTHSCRPGSTQATNLAEQNQNSEVSNAPMIGGSSPAFTDRCWACAEDGRLTLNCLDGCNSFQVITDQDINSISVIGCGPCPPVDFIIPPSTTVGICGWPPGCDNSGDECFEGRITGPRTAKTNGASWAGAPGGPSGSLDNCGCTCPISSLWLSIACCNEDGNCAADCDNPTKIIQLKACGGISPYTWSTLGSIVTVEDFAGVSASVDLGEDVNVAPLTGRCVRAAVSVAGCVGDFDVVICTNPILSCCSYFAGARNGTPPYHWEWNASPNCPPFTVSDVDTTADAALTNPCDNGFPQTGWFAHAPGGECGCEPASWTVTDSVGGTAVLGIVLDHMVCDGVNCDVCS